MRLLVFNQALPCKTRYSTLDATAAGRCYCALIAPQLHSTKATT